MTIAPTPVNEVVLSFAFEPQAVIVGPRIPQILSADFSRYPMVQVAPPYQMPFEYDSPRPRAFGGMLALEPMGMQRHWLIGPDETRIVQVQSDYFALNWRRREGFSYAGYHVLRKEFSGLSERFSDGVRSVGGEVLPNRAEITYINRFEVGKLMGDSGALKNFLHAAELGFDELDEFRVELHSPLNDEGRWVGRLHLHVETSFNLTSGQHEAVLNLTARSGELESRTVKSVLSFIDVAHSAISESFRRLLTPSALSTWGWSD